MLNLFILIVFSVGLLAFLKWFVKKELIDPVFFTSAYWIIFILFSVIFSLIMNLNFYWSGIIPIALLLLAFLAGSFVMKQMWYFVSQKKAEGENNIIEKKNFSCTRIKWLILIFSAMGLLAVFLQLSFLNIHIGSLSDLLHAGNIISVLRYSGVQDMPKLGLVLMAFLYSAGFFGGIYSVVSKGLINKMISLFPFVVIFIFTMTNGVKTGFLFMIVLWVSGYASAYVHEKKGEMKKIGKLMTRIIVIVALILLLIPFTQAFRGGGGRVKAVSAGTLSYFCSFNAFSIWYHDYDNDKLTGYKYTLSGIHNFFYGGREVGLYGNENAIAGKYQGVPITTNVYTMTRGLIEDFTLYGAMGVLFFVGILMQIIYDRTKKKNAFAMALLGLFYSIVLWSFTVNIINYNTIILAWIISLLTGLIVKKKNPSFNKTAEE